MLEKLNCNLTEFSCDCNKSVEADTIKEQSLFVTHLEFILLAPNSVTLQAVFPSKYVGLEK